MNSTNPTTGTLTSMGYQIFPLYFNEKKQNYFPKIKWRELQTRKKPFPDLPDDAPVGIVCGEVHKLTVLDIDTNDRALALMFAKKLIEERLSNYNVRAPIQLTPSGGVHIFMRHIPGTKNRTDIDLLSGDDDLVKRFGDLQFDLRTHGGMVKACPTPGYSFLKSHPLVEASALPYADKRLSALLVKTSNPDSDTSSKSGGSRGLSSKAWKRIVNKTTSGNRNNNATKISGLILKYFPEQKWDVAYELVRAWNRQNVSPPLEEDELERTFKSIAENESRN